MLLPVLLLMASPAKTATAVAGLDARLAAWRQVKMGPGTDGLDATNKKVVLKLVDAARYMESIYWRQNDPAALKLLHDTKDAQLRRMIIINGSRFDLVAENQPFVIGAQFLPGRNLYPPGLARQDVEAFVREHPPKRTPFTVPTPSSVPTAKTSSPFLTVWNTRPGSNPRRSCCAMPPR